MRTEQAIGPQQNNIAAAVLASHLYLVPITTPAYFARLTAWLFVPTSSATVGNRQFEFQILDPAAAVRMRFVTGAVQAASLARKYLFGQGLPDLAAFRDTDFLYTPLPPVDIPPGWTAKIIDNKAIDVADTAVSSIWVSLYPIT